MSDTSGGLYRSSDEATSLLPPEISGSQAKFDVRFGKQIFRRGRRLAVVLSERVLNALAPPEHKPMGEMGSFIFLSNLIMGPGMLGLPVAYLYSGTIWTTFMTFSFATVSVLACLLIASIVKTYKAERLRATLPPGIMAHTLDHVPHLEMENLVRGVANSTSWFFFQLCFLLSMILMAVSCIIVTALSFDSLLILLCGQTWGLQVTPRPRFVEACPAGPWQCEGQIAFQAVSLERGGTVISLGYALTVALTAPLAMVDVSEPFQLASYVVSMVCVLWLIVKFALIAWQDGVEHPPHSSHMPPLWRNNMGLALEVSYWSWVISFAVPMWLDEIEPSMPLEGSLVASFAHRAVLDVLLGFTGAAAFSHMSDTTLNVLQAVAVHPQCGTGTRAAGVTFVISSLASNIVDYAMVAARNLECHVGSNAALIIGVGFPFASGWLFYFGQSFSDLITLASPLLNGVIQFVVPGVLFYLYSSMPKAHDVEIYGRAIPAAPLRFVALAMAVGTLALIVLTYVLTTGDDGGGVVAADYGAPIGSSA